jgi:hypothetical protein
MYYIRDMGGYVDRAPACCGSLFSNPGISHKIQNGRGRYKQRSGQHTLACQIKKNKKKPYGYQFIKIIQKTRIFAATKDTYIAFL